MDRKQRIHVTACATVLAVAVVGCTTQAPVKHKPNQQLIQAGRQKAKELGYNPIPVLVETQGGNVMITGGAILNIRNNQMAWSEGDMAINVGPLPVPIANFTLAEGEYAVVKNGAFVKLPGKLLSDM